MTKLKIKSTIQLKADTLPEIDISEDIDILDLPDEFSDEQTADFFKKFRETKKRKYAEQILALFDTKLEFL